MSRSYVLFVIVLGSTVISGATCSGESPQRIRAEMEPYFDHAELSPGRLRSEVLSADGFLGTPTRVWVTRDHVVVSDRTADRKVHVFARGTGQHASSFGREGRGPGEYTHAPEISTLYGQPDILYAFDGNQGLITMHQLPEGTLVPAGPRTSFPLPFEYPAYQAVVVAGPRAVALGLFPGGRIGIFDLTRGTSVFGGTLPDERYPFNVVQMAHIGHLAAAPSGERIALVTRQAGRVEIYDRSGARIAQTDGPFPFEVDYRVRRRSGMEFGPRNRHGYKGITAAADRFYALFSGRAEAHFPGPVGHDSEFIHVFDWAGRLERVYRLDRPVNGIAIAPDGSALYAVTVTPEPAVLRFPLP